MPLFAIFLVAFSFLGCSLKIARPVVEACVLKVETGKCLCTTKRLGEPLKALRIENLKHCDLAIAFPPDSWEVFKNYLDEIDPYYGNQK